MKRYPKSLRERGKRLLVLIALLIVLETGFLKCEAKRALARLRDVPRRLRTRLKSERPPCYDERWTLLRPADPPRGANLPQRREQVITPEGFDPEHRKVLERSARAAQDAIHRDV